MGSLVIVVVDQEPDAHDAIADALAMEEYALLGARTAALAVRVAERRTPRVLVIDGASVADPADLLAQVRRIAPNIRAVMLARDPDEAARLSAFGPVLTKPFDAEALRSALRDVARVATRSSTPPDREGVIAAQAVWRRVTDVAASSEPSARSRRS